MEIVKRFWYLILIGLVIRILVAGFTFHSDIKAPALASAVYLRLGELNPYEQSFRLMPNEVLDDLPLGYFIALPIHSIGRLLVDEQVESVFFLSQDQVFGDYKLWLYLIYAKLPTILFDVAIGVVLALILKTFSKKVLLIWMLNPFAIWVSSAVGQIDVYPAFFITLACYFITKNNLNLGALSLGLGVAVKTAPFLLLPFLLGLRKDMGVNIKLLLLAAAPYLISVIPYLPSADFRQDAFFAPQLNKVFYSQLSLSGGESIFLIVFFLTLLYMSYFAKKREGKDFLGFSIVTLLLTLSFTHFHIQWFLWVMPLLIIWLISNLTIDTKLAASVLLVSLSAMMFLFEASLQVKLFAPLFPWLDTMKGLGEVLNTDQLHFARSLAASVFASASVYLAIKILIMGKYEK